MKFSKLTNCKLFYSYNKIFIFLAILISHLTTSAAITVGNQTFSNITPPFPDQSSYTITTHTQNTGTNGYMVVGVVGTSTYGVTVSSVTWNGVSMTELQQATITNASGRMALYGLASPATGNHDLVVTWSGAQSYSVSISILSFTGAQAGGNSSINQADGNPTTPSITISDQSMILGYSYSNFGTTTIELPQNTSRSLLFTHAPYGGSLSAALSPALSSGATTCEANTGGGSASLALVEIKAAAALPVQFSSFEAVLNSSKSQVDLSWSTTMEENNKYFVLERSLNGVDWFSIDSIKGAGNSNSLLHYSYVDKNLISGVSYYRIKQVDFDRKENFSNIKVVNFESIKILSVYPNPSNGEIHILFNTPIYGNVSLKVYDDIGKLIKNENILVSEETSKIDLKINVAKGKYYLSVLLSNGEYFSQPIVMSDN